MSGWVGMKIQFHGGLWSGLLTAFVSPKCRGKATVVMMPWLSFSLQDVNVVRKLSWKLKNIPTSFFLTDLRLVVSTLIAWNVLSTWMSLEIGNPIPIVLLYRSHVQRGYVITRNHPKNPKIPSSLQVCEIVLKLRTLLNKVGIFSNLFLPPSTSNW